MRTTGTDDRTDIPLHERLRQTIAVQVEGARDVRRGVCLLNAGQPQLARQAFEHARAIGYRARSLPRLLAGCLVAEGRHDLAEFILTNDNDPQDTAKKNLRNDRIRRAYAMAESGKLNKAIQLLRNTNNELHEDAEILHQLGLLYASVEQYENAESCFSDALVVDAGHTGALTNLALCCGMRNMPDEALKHLQKCQAKRPHDARIGILLSQAAAALQQAGATLQVRAVMPIEQSTDYAGIEELSLIIEHDPEFVDAFLAMEKSEVDEHVFALLLRTLELALERQPEHAELHFHCGQLLSRLGRADDAIDAAERAVQLDPKFTRTLVELGRLYSETDKETGDAVDRLKQAIAQGAEYADVHFLLGNLHRRQGRLDAARNAYRRALRINNQYSAAQQALASLHT